MRSVSYENPFELYKLGSAASFRPEWDVPSINKDVSDAINRMLDRVRKQERTDDRQTIPVLLGPAGYGKTHLFGRIRQFQEERLFFVYVPQVIEPERPTAHVRWHVVEALFHAEPGRLPPLAAFLGELLRPSFHAFFDGLPPPVAARHQTLRQQLEQGPGAVLEIIRASEALVPFHRLADSLAAGFPSLPGDVVRALVLGASPAGHEARRWLRGDSLAPETLASLRLGEEPPSAAGVLRSVAVLLQRLATPVVLCVDQMEAVLKAEQGPKELTTELMGWLDSTPNLVIVANCLLGKEWEELKGKGFQSFVQRTTPFKLAPLTGSQAVDLVRRRMRDWEEYQPGPEAAWPFDAASIERYAVANPLPARGLIQQCAKRFAEWLNNRTDSRIRLEMPPPPPPPLEELFLQQWNQELLAIQQTKLSSHDQQEDRLFACVLEALKLAKDGNLIPGTQVLAIQEGALTKGANDPRPSAELRLSVGPQAFGVLVAVTRNDAGPRFAAYVNALEASLGGQVVGGALIRPSATLKVAPTAQAARKYYQAIGSEKLRVFALDQEQQTFEQLECLLRTLQNAGSGNLQLDGRPVSRDRCRELILKLKLFENLKLFDAVFTWPAGGAVQKSPKLTPEASVSGTPMKHPTGEGAPSRVRQSQANRKVVGDAPGPPRGGPKPPEAWADDMLDRVVEQLNTWHQPVVPHGFEIGPTFARLKVIPQGQTDVNKVRRKAENLQIILDLATRPVIATQAGYISIDVQRPDRQTVSLAQALASRNGSLEGQPAFPVGTDVSGHTHWLNLADPSTCHLLIAGTTGSGKSEFMKALLASLASELGPDQLRFVLIDPKQVTFNFQGESPYLLDPIAHDIPEALPLIRKCFNEMERRYGLLKERQKENVSELSGQDALPRIVLLFDEFADLMLDKDSKKELETLLKRIGAKARAAGIHLVLGTQRTEASVVTPLLRSNLPGRISLKVMSEKDSKLILDAPDAAHLLGKGDLLWWHRGGLLRLQSPFVARRELEQRLRLV
jgi:hypothetical protein